MSTEYLYTLSVPVTPSKEPPFAMTLKKGPHMKRHRLTCLCMDPGDEGLAVWEGVGIEHENHPETFFSLPLPARLPGLGANTGWVQWEFASAVTIEEGMSIVLLFECTTRFETFQVAAFGQWLEPLSTVIVDGFR